MQKTFPFTLPKSLESHLELFEKDAAKAIHSLERHLKRRAYDAVGHLLLAWFYHSNGDRESAQELAIKAKTFAPGSPFFENLPYYFSHPKGFDAWLPDTANDYYTIMRSAPKKNRLYVDLDGLISKLSAIESSKIEVKDDAPVNPAKSVQNYVDEIATETLARIYEGQNELEKAIKVYQKIKERQPERKAFCDDHINRLKSLIDEKKN
jgi:tetratricopeptide (TPR) repeat protein